MCILTYTAKAQFSPLPANSTALMPTVHQQFFDSNGAPLSGGYIQAFATGTSTPHQTYQDSIGTVNPLNTIPLDAGGFADIWLDNTVYRICVFNSANVQQYCKDGISAAPAVLGQTYAQLSGGNVFTGGAQVIDAQGTATSLANFDSHSFRLRAAFWNGLASANDDWLVVNKMGPGANPTSTLTFSHSGSSGAATLDLSNVNLAGTNLLCTPVASGSSISFSGAQKTLITCTIPAAKLAVGNVLKVSAMIFNAASVACSYGWILQGSTTQSIGIFTGITTKSIRAELSVPIANSNGANLANAYMFTNDAIQFAFTGETYTLNIANTIPVSLVANCASGTLLAADFIVQRLQ